MLAKTLAIVLGSVKYGESSIILKTFTREKGLQSFMVNGVRSKKGVVKPAMTLPLSQLNLVYYERSKGELKRIKEASVHYLYQSIPFEPEKNCMALFLAEVVSHLLHQDDASPELFDFLEEAFTFLEETTVSIANFHLAFLYQLTAYVGFFPEKANTSAIYFDLAEGIYSHSEPLHPHFIKGELLAVWRQMGGTHYSKCTQIAVGSATRAALLNAILEYYRLHVKDFGELKSLDVLHQVLR